MAACQWSEAVALAALHDAAVRRDFELSWNAGWSHYKLGNLPQAIDYLLNAVALDPISSSGRWALGVVLMDHGDSQGAELHLLRSLTLREGYLPRDTLALLYLKQGRLTEAEQLHRQGLAIRPDSRERLESYADFLMDTGRRHDAIKVYQQAESSWYEARGRAT
jgi:tetratricopeptide (TPR) repeat protein